MDSQDEIINSMIRSAFGRETRQNENTIKKVRDYIETNNFLMINKNDLETHIINEIENARRDINGEYQEQIKSLEDEISRMKRTMVNIDTLDTLKENDENSKLNEISELRRLTEDQRAQIEETGVENIRLSEENVLLNSEIRRLQETIERLSVATKNADQYGISQTVNESGVRISALQKTIDTLTRENEELSLQLANMSAEMEERVLSLKTENDELRQQQAEQSLTIQEQKLLQDRLQNTIADTISRNSEFQRNISELQNEKNVMASTIESLNRNNTSELSSTGSSNNNNGSNISVAAEMRISELIAEINEKKSTNARLIQEEQQYKAAFQELNEQLSALESTNAQQLAELEAARAENGRLQQTNEEHQQLNAQLAEEVATLKNNNAVLNRENTRAQGVNDNMHNFLDRINKNSGGLFETEDDTIFAGAPKKRRRNDAEESMFVDAVPSSTPSNLHLRPIQYEDQEAENYTVNVTEDLQPFFSRNHVDNVTYTTFRGFKNTTEPFRILTEIQDVRYFTIDVSHNARLAGAFARDFSERYHLILENTPRYNDFQLISSIMRENKFSNRILAPAIGIYNGVRCGLTGYFVGDRSALMFLAEAEAANPSTDPSVRNTIMQWVARKLILEMSDRNPGRFQDRYIHYKLEQAERELWDKIYVPSARQMQYFHRQAIETKRLLQSL